MLLDEIDCCVFRRTDSLDRAIAGDGDLDILIARTHLGRLKSRLRERGGLETRVHPTHDNACPDRTEWFLRPNDTSPPVHFDMQTVVRTGPRHHKRLAAFTFGDVGKTETRPTVLGPVRITEPAFEQRERAAKAAFEAKRLFGFGAPLSVPGEPGGVANNRSLARMRSELRRANRQNIPAYAASWLLSFGKFCIYKSIRVLDRIGVRTWPSRSPVGGGLVIALLGTDGTGKSTNAAWLAETFSRKFGVCELYLGSSGMLSALALRFRHRSGERSGSDEKGGNPPSGKDVLEDALRASWGLWLALYRLRSVRRARRLARRGYIVICDRWPQNIERGILDGPVRRKTSHAPSAIEFLFSLEERIYRKIELCRPDMTFSLDAPFEVVESRKPGELTTATFERRVDLLRRIAERSAHHHSIDATEPLGKVQWTIFSHVWRHLVARQADLANSGPAIIEFFGLPGVGKTTVAGELHRQMSSERPGLLLGSDLTFDAATNPARLLGRLGLIARELPHTIQHLPHLWRLARMPQASARHRMKAVFNTWTCLSVNSRLVRRQLSGVLDQGVAQAVFSALLFSDDSAPSRELLEAVLPDAGFRYHLVLVKADAEVAKTRLASRDSRHSRLQRLDQGSEDLTWQRAVDLVDRIAAHARDLADEGRLTLHEIGSESGDPETDARRIAAKVGQT